VQINTLLPGFSPEQMEKQVTYVIETGLAGIPGLSNDPFAFSKRLFQVTAIFDDESTSILQGSKSMNGWRCQRPASKWSRHFNGPISTGLGEILCGASSTSTPRGRELLSGTENRLAERRLLHNSGSTDSQTEAEKASYLRTLQDWVIKPQLKAIQGLADIDSIGGYVRQYQTNRSWKKNDCPGLSFQEIIDALRRII